MGIGITRTDTHHIHIEVIIEDIAIVDHHIQIETTMEDVARHHIEVDTEMTTTVINRMIRIEIIGDVVHHMNQIDAHMVVEVIQMGEGINIGLEHLIRLIRTEEGAQEGMEIEILDTPRDPPAPTLTKDHEGRKGVDLAVDHPLQTDLVVISVTLAHIEQ